ncbi:tetratricopeptide repeat protein [Chondromyces crocatus]|nr:tetratricopeptide repeat protein [Chondromyces crocatus]
MSWHEHPEGRAGFLRELLVDWSHLNAQVERAWSPALVGRQMKCSALAWLLTCAQEGLRPSVLAAALRLEIWPSRVILAELAHVRDPFTHRTSVRAVLPLLEAHALDELLLTADITHPRAYPVPELVARLVAEGRWDDAVAWALAPDLDGQRLDQVGPLFVAAPAVHRERVRDAVRSLVEALDGEEGVDALDPDEVEERIEILLAAARVLEGEERHALLARASAGLEAMDDAALQREPGEPDLRAKLAEALFAANQPEEARAWLARAGEHLAGDRAAPGTVEHLRKEVESGDPTTARAAAARLFDLFVAAASPDDGANDRAASVRLVWRVIAIGKAAAYLGPERCHQALARVWALTLSPPQPLSGWDLGGALIALLRAAEEPQRSHLAAKLCEHALRHPEMFPPLCEFSGWEEVYSTAEQRAYLQHLLRRCRLSKPAPLVRALLQCSAGCDALLRLRAGEAALHVARLHEAHELVPEVAAAVPSLWTACVAHLDAVHRPPIAVWAELLASVPPEQATALAQRLMDLRHDEIATSVFAPSFLSALPLEEAERHIDRFSEGSRRMLPLGRLPEPLSLRVFRHRRDALRGREDHQQRLAQLLVDAIPLRHHACVAHERAALFSWVGEQLASAPDESARAETEHAIWLLCHPLSLISDLADLDAFRASILARGSARLLRTLNGRYLTLKAPEQVDWRGGPDEFESPVWRALGMARTREELRAALALDPGVVGYPWVAERVLERGLGAAFAELATEQPRADERVRIWRSIWASLDSPTRHALWPALRSALDTCREEKRLERFALLPWLTAPQAQSEWIAEQSMQCTERYFELTPAFTGPLSAWTEHTQALLEIVAQCFPEEPTGG